MAGDPSADEGARLLAKQKPVLGTIGKPLPDLETDKEFQEAWKITKAEEERILQQFHEELVADGLYRPDHDKYYIRRFLRGRQHDISKAKAMYSDHLKWRRENGVDEIMTSFEFAEREQFLTVYPQGYHKTDKLGRPIYIQHLGSINIKKLNEITTEERMIDFHIQEYERCTKYIMQACSRTSGHHVDQTFAIIDVHGVGMSHLTGQVKGLLGKITAIDQANYPEMMGKTLIINTPGFFKVVWNLVKRFLDARTLAKIELHGASYQSAIFKYVDKENVPEYLGGTSKATLVDDAGPWKDDQLLEQIDADYRAAVSHDVDADSTARNAAPEVTSSGQLGRPSSTSVRPLQVPGVSASGRAPSPARRSITRMSSRERRSYQPPAQLTLAAVAGGNEHRFSDAVELQTRATSMTSDADDGYYSPRSDSNFSSFTEPNSTLDEESSHPRLHAADPRTGHVSERHMSLAMRIRRLENTLPGLREKLKQGMNSDKFANGGFTSTGGNNTLGRVEALEDAVEILYTIQEEQLQSLANQSQEKADPKESIGETPTEKEKSSCGCCTIM